jgi:O-antigen/teichoic acid export membrane protein
MSTARSLLKGSFLRHADLCLALGATFFVTPLIVRSLGNRMFGVWTIIGAVIGYYGVLDLGFSYAASRYLSQSLGKGDAEDLDSVANSAFFLFCLIGLAALLATLLTALACPLFMRDPAETALFRRIILLLGTAMAIGFPLRVYLGILTSYIRYDSISYISIARTLMANAAIYRALSKGYGIMGLAVIAFVVSLLQSAAFYAVCTAQFPDIKITFFRFDGAKIRAMCDHSWKTFICMICNIVRMQMDTVLIAYFLNVSLVTPYVIGARLVDGFNQLVLNSVGMMLPVFSRYEGQGDHDAIRSALLKVTRLSAVLSAYVGFSIIFYAPAFIRRWMGPGFESSYWVAAILCAGFILHLPQYPGVQLLYALSKHEYYAALSACEAALNLALSLIFLKHYGMYGVALGTAVEMIIFKLFVQPVYICRVSGLPIRDYLVDNILGTLAKAAAPLAVYFFLIKGLVLPNYARLCECAAVQTLLFIPTAYFFIMSEAERRYVDGLIASFFEKPVIQKNKGINVTA